QGQDCKDREPPHGHCSPNHRRSSDAPPMAKNGPRSNLWRKLGGSWTVADPPQPPCGPIRLSPRSPGPPAHAILVTMPRQPLAVPRLSLPAALLVSLAIVAAVAGVLLWMGRIPMCQCGTIKLWHGGRGDSEMSQHLTDWYTYSHVLHGLIFYWLLTVVARGRL